MLMRLVTVIYLQSLCMVTHCRGRKAYLLILYNNKFRILIITWYSMLNIEQYHYLQIFKSYNI